MTSERQCLRPSAKLTLNSQEDTVKRKFEIPFEYNFFIDIVPDDSVYSHRQHPLQSVMYNSNRNLVSYYCSGERGK